MNRKGIVLAGGTGSRLWPLTKAVSKQLLPVHDKPMIWYPLSTLMLAGIRDILVITTPRDQAAFRDLLGDGSMWGVAISYAVQERPAGIAQALMIAEPFLDGQGCALVLGDNIFFGAGLVDTLRLAAGQEDGATVFGYWVKDPSSYGVAVLTTDGALSDLVEKPAVHVGNWAVTGLYFYDATAPARARALRPSPRGELEITDLNRAYLADGALRMQRFGRGTAWLDTGTHESLYQAGEFIHAVEARQGLKVACLEEIAFRQGWIDGEGLARCIDGYGSSSYADYLRTLRAAGPHAP